MFKAPHWMQRWLGAPPPRQPKATLAPPSDSAVLYRDDEGLWRVEVSTTPGLPREIALQISKRLVTAAIDLTPSPR